MFFFTLFYFILIKNVFVENVLLICILLVYAKIERFQISPLRTYNKDIFEKIIYENTFVISTKCWLYDVSLKFPSNARMNRQIYRLFYIQFRTLTEHLFYFFEELDPLEILSR
jgi:hypothetical protein